MDADDAKFRRSNVAPAQRNSALDALGRNVGNIKLYFREQAICNDCSMYLYLDGIF